MWVSDGGVQVEKVLAPFERLRFEFIWAPFVVKV